MLHALSLLWRNCDAASLQDGEHRVDLAKRDVASNGFILKLSDIELHEGLQVGKGSVIERRAKYIVAGREKPVIEDERARLHAALEEAAEISMRVE